VVHKFDGDRREDGMRFTARGLGVEHPYSNTLHEGKGQLLVDLNFPKYTFFVNTRRNKVVK